MTLYSQKRKVLYVKYVSIFVSLKPKLKIHINLGQLNMRKIVSNF